MLRRHEQHLVSSEELSELVHVHAEREAEMAAALREEFEATQQQEATASNTAHQQLLEVRSLLLLIMSWSLGLSVLAASHPSVLRVKIIAGATQVKRKHIITMTRRCATSFFFFFLYFFHRRRNTRTQPTWNSWNPSFRT